MPAIDKNGRRWRIWQTADKLEEQAKVFYPQISPKVVSILRTWGETWAGKEGWMSLLDKGSLFHEIQECIVAIHNLHEERIQSLLADRNDNGGTCSGSGCLKYIALDVCAGKGLFSFLLSYLKFDNLDQIVMLEKATINWHHIHEANKTAKLEGRPEIIIWSKTNLHEYDSVLNRILNLPHPVAMTGIHLCKQLSPSFCGLVNGLGKKCVHACLAPCCLPRAVTAQKNSPKNNGMGSSQSQRSKSYTVSIQLEESAQERLARKDYMERRERVRRKPLDGPCFLCNEENHNLLTCTILPTLAMEAQIKTRQAFHAATVPCWNCLEYGHFRSECPKLAKNNGIMKNSTSHPPQHPPTLKLDVAGVLKEERPFYTYCHLLAQSFEMAVDKDDANLNSGWKTRRSVDVVETNLEKSGKHDDGNWNNERKSIFLIIQ